MADEIIWEFECSCGHELELPASQTDFSPTALVKPECDNCGSTMRHVGPILDECDRCGQELLYKGCPGTGHETWCERCYERAEVILP